MYEGLERRISDVEPKDFREALLVIEALRQENMKLKDDAKYDSKTGLYSYDYFKVYYQPYLEEVINSYHSSSEESRQTHNLHLVVIADLNNLKIMNETKGYEAGDDAIKKAAASLRSSLRSDDLIIRVNTAGDEFMAIISTDSDPYNIDITASLIISRIKNHFTRNSSGLLSLAVGYSVLEDSSNFTDSRIIAEKSMQRDKLLQKRANNDEMAKLINFL